jgi:hypothetical protein
VRCVLVPLTATLAVACSSDSGALTLDEWAIEVCNSRNALGSLPAPTGLADLAAFERVADGFDEAVTDLNGLSPPKSARDYHHDLLQFYRGISSAQREFIKAAAKGDAATLSTATAEYQAGRESEVSLDLSSYLGPWQGSLLVPHSGQSTIFVLQHYPARIHLLTRDRLGWGCVTRVILKCSTGVE